MQCIRFCIVFIVNVIVLIIVVVIIISMIIIIRIIIINLLEVYLQPAAARMHTGLPRDKEPKRASEHGRVWSALSAGYTNSNGRPNELNWLLEDLHTLCVCLYSVSIRRRFSNVIIKEERNCCNL